MESEWNLSDKAVLTLGFNKENSFTFEEKDVREFIKRLKQLKVGIETSIHARELTDPHLAETKILRLTAQVRELFEKEIDKLAGDKLV